MLAPDFYYDSVFMIPYQELLNKNIRGLIYDLDNTLAPYNMAYPPAKITALMRRLQRMGFKICLLTNNNEKRLRIFNEHLNIQCIHSAKKPFTGGIKRAMQSMGTCSQETAIIGDQLFSDIWGGKNAKIITIMVKPVSSNDIVAVKIKRGLERLFMRAFFKRAEKSNL